MLQTSNRMEGERLFTGDSDYSLCYQPLSSSSSYLILFLTLLSSYAISIHKHVTEGSCHNFVPYYLCSL